MITTILTLLLLWIFGVPLLTLVLFLVVWWVIETSSAFLMMLITMLLIYMYVYYRAQWDASNHRNTRPQEVWWE